MTHRELAGWLRQVDPGLIRVRAGFSLRTIARACGVTWPTVWKWEKDCFTPTGEPGARYVRIIQGLIRHLEVTE